MELCNFSIGLPYATLILATIVTVHWTLKQLKRKHQLDKIPGPKAIPLLGNSLDLIRSENIINDFVQFSKIYGSPYKLRIGNHLYVVLSTAEHIEEFFRKSKSTHKTDLFDKFKDVFGQSIFTSADDEWKLKRKCLLRTMNGKRLDNFECVFQQETNKLVEELKTKQNTIIDLWEFLPYLGFCIVAKTNVNLDAQPPVSRSEFQFHSIMKEMFNMNFKRVTHPWYQSDIIAKLVFGKRIKENEKILRSLIRKIIEQNETKIKKHVELKDLENDDERNYAETAHVLAENAGKPNILNDEILLSLSAGTINVSLIMAYFLLMMGMFPEIQEKIYEELIDALGNEKDISSASVSKLLYLDQVLKETLRRFTLIPLIFRKLEKNLEIEGDTIPAGTNIAISIVDVHFSCRYYDDPWNFNPDNFEPQLSLKRPKYAYLPFAAGPRDCLGKMYAILEMKIVLANLLRVYKFSTDMKMTDIKLDYSFLVTNLSGFNVKIEERKK